MSDKKKRNKTISITSKKRNKPVKIRLDEFGEPKNKRRWAKHYSKSEGDDYAIMKKGGKVKRTKSNYNGWSIQPS